MKIATTNTTLLTILTVLIALFAIGCGEVTQAPAPETGSAAEVIAQATPPTETSTSTPTPIPTLASTSTPMPYPSTNENVQDNRQYMLELINEERDKVGFQQLTLGDHTIVQQFAENQLRDCISSHWGLDGSTLHMNYSRAGRHQSTRGYLSGSDYCLDGSKRNVTKEEVQRIVRRIVRGDCIISVGQDTFSSGGNCLDVSLNPKENGSCVITHGADEFEISRSCNDAGEVNTDYIAGLGDDMREGKYQHSLKLDIGLTWDGADSQTVLVFEREFIQYDMVPSIDDQGNISLSGQVINGAELSQPSDLGIALYYDNPPEPLTAGQISKTYSVGDGQKVASLRHPPSEGSFWPNDSYTHIYKPHINPHDFDPDSPVATNADESSQLWREAARRHLERPEIEITVPWVTADIWDVSSNSFVVKANIADILNERGNGVFTVVVWATLDGEDISVSEYKIFR